MEDGYDLKGKVTAGFAESILASSPARGDAMNPNSLSDQCGAGAGGSTSQSPAQSCSPCPNEEEPTEQDFCPKDQLDTLWPKQFGVAAGRKDGDSGFISPDGAASNAVLEPAPVDLLAEPGMNILAPAFRPKLSQGTENDYANFQYNATPSLEVEIESQPLDSSLESDAEASEYHGKNEESFNGTVNNELESCTQAEKLSFEQNCSQEGLKNQSGDILSLHKEIPGNKEEQVASFPAEYQEVAKDDLFSVEKLKDEKEIYENKICEVEDEDDHTEKKDEEKNYSSSSTESEDEVESEERQYPIMKKEEEISNDEFLNEQENNIDELSKKDENGEPTEPRICSELQLEKNLEVSDAYQSAFILTNDGTEEKKETGEETFEEDNAMHLLHDYSKQDNDHSSSSSSEEEDEEYKGKGEDFGNDKDSKVVEQLHNVNDENIPNNDGFSAKTNEERKFSLQDEPVDIKPTNETISEQATAQYEVEELRAYEDHKNHEIIESQQDFLDSVAPDVNFTKGTIEDQAIKSEVVKDLHEELFDERTNHEIINDKNDSSCDSDEEAEEIGDEQNIQSEEQVDINDLEEKKVDDTDDEDDLENVPGEKNDGSSVEIPDLAPTNTFLTENHERTADLDKVESEPQSSEITNQETFEPNFNQNLMEDEKCVNDAIKSAVVGKMDQKEIVSDENETESFLQPSADLHKNMDPCNFETSFEGTNENEAFVAKEIKSMDAGSKGNNELFGLSNGTDANYEDAELSKDLDGRPEYLHENEVEKKIDFPAVETAKESGEKITDVLHEETSFKTDYNECTATAKTNQMEFETSSALVAETEDALTLEENTQQSLVNENFQQDIEPNFSNDLGHALNSVDDREDMMEQTEFSGTSDQEAELELKDNHELVTEVMEEPTEMIHTEQPLVENGVTDIGPDHEEELGLKDNQESDTKDVQEPAEVVPNKKTLEENCVTDSDCNRKSVEEIDLQNNVEDQLIMNGYKEQELELPVPNGEKEHGLTAAEVNDFQQGESKVEDKLFSDKIVSNDTEVINDDDNEVPNKLQTDQEIPKEDASAEVTEPVQPQQIENMRKTTQVLQSHTEVLSQLPVAPSPEAEIQAEEPKKTPKPPTSLSLTKTTSAGVGSKAGKPAAGRARPTGQPARPAGRAPPAATAAKTTSKPAPAAAKAPTSKPLPNGAASRAGSRPAARPASASTTKTTVSRPQTGKTAPGAAPTRPATAPSAARPAAAPRTPLSHRTTPTTPRPSPVPVALRQPRTTSTSRLREASAARKAAASEASKASLARRQELRTARQPISLRTTPAPTASPKPAPAAQTPSRPPAKTNGAAKPPTRTVASKTPNKKPESKVNGAKAATNGEKN